MLLVAAVVGLTMTSCKKDYTCECTFTGKIYQNGVETNGQTTTASTATGKMKKDDAKTKCEQSNGTIMSGTTQFGTSTTTDCKIK